MSDQEGSTLIGQDMSRYYAPIGWDHTIRHPTFLPTLVLYGIRIGGFYAGKGSIKGAGVSNIMIPAIIDSFCVCPPIRVSLCQTWSAPLWLEVRQKSFSNSLVFVTPRLVVSFSRCLFWLCFDSATKRCCFFPKLSGNARMRDTFSSSRRYFHPFPGNVILARKHFDCFFQ